MNKIIKGWLIVNTSRGSLRAVKKPRRLKASEVAIELKLDIDIPEKPILKAEGKITLGATQLAGLMVEQLKDASDEVKE